LYDTERRSEPVPDDEVVQEEYQKPSEDSHDDGKDTVNEPDNIETPSSDTSEFFELKKEAEYVQLRLSVTSSAGKMQLVEDYLTRSLNTDAKKDYMGNTYFEFPRENYDLALSAIIDCPHTENVIYKNEDYYPVACEIYSKSANDGKLSQDAIEYIENIENMCKKIIIAVN